jgi:hypothetical protein
LHSTPDPRPPNDPTGVKRTPRYTSPNDAPPEHAARSIATLIP